MRAALQDDYTVRCDTCGDDIDRPVECVLCGRIMCPACGYKASGVWVCGHHKLETYETTLGFSAFGGNCSVWLRIMYYPNREGSGIVSKTEILLPFAKKWIDASWLWDVCSNSMNKGADKVLI